MVSYSSNGTFVNGQRVVSDDRRRILRSGDYVQLYRKERMPSEDPRHLCKCSIMYYIMLLIHLYISHCIVYRIFLPPQFEVGVSVE